MARRTIGMVTNTNGSPALMLRNQSILFLSVGFFKLGVMNCLMLSRLWTWAVP